MTRINAGGRARYGPATLTDERTAKDSRTARRLAALARQLAGDLARRVETDPELAAAALTGECALRGCGARHPSAELLELLAVVKVERKGRRCG